MVGLVGEALGSWFAWANDVAVRMGVPLAVSLPRRAMTVADGRSRLPAGVEDAKFLLGPEPVPLATADPGMELERLPAAYGEDILVLLPRDPWCLFAYWEVSPRTRAAAVWDLGADGETVTEVLRVSDVTLPAFGGENAWRTTDVEVSGAGRLYLRVPRPGASYAGQIGLRTATGRFVPLVTSAPIATPRAAASPDQTLRWVNVTPREAAPRTAADPPPPASSLV